MATKIVYTDETIRVKSVKVGIPIKRVSAGAFSINNLSGVDVTAVESDGSILAYKTSTGNYEITGLRSSDNITVTYDSAVSNYTFAFTNGTFTGSLIPDSDEVYDLGSPTKKFKDLFLSGNTITLGSLSLKDSEGSFLIIDSDGVALNLSISLGTNNSNILSFDSAAGSFSFNDTDIARTDINDTFHQGLTVNNGLVVNDGLTVVSGSNTTGGVTTDSATVTNNLAVGSNLTIGGNLTVSGTTTTINTETIELADNTIVLNSNAIGSATENAGIEIERGDDSNVSFLWDEATNYWTLGGQTLETTGKILYGNVYPTEGDLPSASLYHGMYAHVHAAGRGYFAHAGSWHKLIDSDTTGVQQVYNLKSFNANIDSATITNISGTTADYTNLISTNLTNTNLTGSQATFDNATIGTLQFTTLTNTTSDITEGSNLYYTRSRFDSALGDTTSIGTIRGYLSAAGDLSYDSSTGTFSFDVEQVYTKTNFDSDLGAALDGGTGITYDSSTDTISITNTGVVAGTYGSATQIPVFTVNAQGQLDSAGTVTVAGVTSLTFDSATGNISIGTADGATFVTTATLDPYTTTNLVEGINLYYTNNRVNTQIGTDSAAAIIRQHFSAAGDLSYNASTGQFSFDVEQVYTKTNFDSDLGAALSGGTGITYDSANDAISITPTGVVAGTYGSATEIPVFTVNAQGQLDSAGTTTVAGVSSINFDSSNGNFTINTADGQTFLDTITLDPYSTTGLTEGNNLYYTRVRFDSALGDTTSISSIRGYFSAGGALNYDSSLGRFTFDTEQVYTKTNFDSDLSTSITGGTGITWDSATYNISITDTGVTAGTYGSASEVPVFTVNAQGQLDSAGTVTVAGVSNVSYDSASYTLTVNTADGGSFPAFLRTTSGVVAGTYGSATQIPIIKVDEFGEVDSVSTIAVAGVTSTSYDSSTSIFTINTADGGTFTAKLDPQYLDADSAKITTLNLTTLTGTTANITNVTSDSATITNLANTTLTGQNATFDSAQITNISASTLASTTSLTLGSTLAYAQNFGSLSFNQNDFYGDSLNTVFMFTSQDSSDTSASVALGVRNQFQTVLGAVGTADSNQFVLGYPNANWQLLIKKDVGNTPYNLQGGTTLFEMDSNGDIKLASTTNSISRTTGSLVLAGGLGVGGNLRGNDIFSAGNMQAAGAFIGNVTGQVSDISNHSTTDLSEGNNLYYTQVRFDSAFGDKSTTDLSEGNNLYYTTARADSDAKNAISVSDAGGDGSLTYSASTGIITYNGPSATEVRAHLVAGTGVGYDSATGIISVGQPIGIGDSVQFSGATIGGNLTITGDFNVVGSQNITSQNDLRITNAIIKVADSNAQDIYDIGVVGRYGDDSGTIRRAGFVRDATNGEWYVFTNLIQDGLDSSVADQTINFNDSSFELGTFNFGALRGTYLGFDSDFRVFSTNYSVVTSNTTASSSQRIAVDTSGGSFTVTLPASPVTGDYVKIIDVGNWSDTSLFIGRNGSTIEGYSDDFELDIGQNVVEFIYINSTWNIYTSIGQRGETGPAGAAADSANFASTNEAIAFAVALG